MRVRVRVRVRAGRAPPQLSGGQLGDGGGEEDGQWRLEAEGRDRVVLEARERGAGGALHHALRVRLGGRDLGFGIGLGVRGRG